MNIADAKQHVKDTVEAYFMKDDEGMYFIPTAKQRPIFLLGAPGIGKTAIMTQIAQELQVGLVSYSMTHHTRQSALGLPLIVHREFEGLEYESSEYTMSEIVASIYDYMEQTGIRRGILFLDEINCVSETLYPSMLQFLQFKTFGRHRIPDDWVVVCAGNPPEYNRSVHEFDIVTMDRLRKVTVEPDYASWRAYATEYSVHPAILSYLDVKKDNFYSVISTPGGKRFVTARGWEDLSEVIKLFERMNKPIDKDLLEQFLQHEDISESFSLYYALFKKYRSDYQVDSILAGETSEEIKQRAIDAKFDERLALIGIILDALVTDMNETLLREAVLAKTRDALRDMRPLFEENNQTVSETLGDLIRSRREKLETGKQAGTLNSQKIRRERRFIEALDNFQNACVLAGTMEGPAAFETIHYEYRGNVSEFERAMKASSAKLDCAYAFMDEVFPEGRETLVFTTEVTSRNTLAQFISRFGNDSYYAHNESMLVDKHKQELENRVAALNVDATTTKESLVATSKSQASAKEIEAETLRKYYEGAQFEYGFASLCKMVLPEDLYGKTVLDIGSRRGKGVFKLSDRVGETGHVIGLEWAKEHFEEADKRSEKAWHDTGLSSSNMTFLRGYPEDLIGAGVAENSCDVVYVNSVINLAYNRFQALNQIYQVLKPGGLLICETVVADADRDQQVVNQAIALGNSIQAAPSRKVFEDNLAEIGFAKPTYSDAHDVLPDQGYKSNYKVEVAESSEDVRFVAAVVHAVKPF